MQNTILNIFETRFQEGVAAFLFICANVKPKEVLSDMFISTWRHVKSLYLSILTLISCLHILILDTTQGNEGTLNELLIEIK